MRHLLVRPAIWLLGASGLATGAALAAGPGFTRVQEQSDGVRSTLEMAIKAYRPADGNGPTVYLAAAIHIGEPEFYHELQMFLDAQDVVLFEGVQPPGQSRDPRWDLPRDDEVKAAITAARANLLALHLGRYYQAEGRYPADMTEFAASLDGEDEWLIAPSLLDAWGRGFFMSTVTPEDGSSVAWVGSLGADGAVGGEGFAADVFASPQFLPEPEAQGARGDGLQQKLADALHLEFQLASMDHSAPNWRNSDVSVDVIQQRLEELNADNQGEALFDVLSGKGFMGRLSGFLVGIIGASDTLRETTKAMLVDLLANAEDILPAQEQLLGPLMDVILHERNQVVLADLEQVLKEPGVRTIGVIYGAGHLPDIEKVLLSRFKYVQSGETWVPALTADLGKAGMSPKQAQRMRDMLRRQMGRQLKRASGN